MVALAGVCIKTVEGGVMTKDLAILARPEQNRMTSWWFPDQYLKAAMD